jgi:hypothetical protein
MTTGKMSDEALFAFIGAHRDFRDRIASIVSAVENSEGDLKEADAAEERIVAEMRLLGREAMQGWADKQVEVTEREIRQRPHMHRQGKKSLLAYESRRNSGHGATISVRDGTLAPVRAKRENQPPGLFTPLAARDHRFCRR